MRVALQGPTTHMVGAASQAGTLLPDEHRSSRNAAQQAETQALAAGAQHAARAISGSASPDSLADSLPDMSFGDMLRRPASAPSASVQTLTAAPPLHPASRASAGTLPVGAQTQMQQQALVAAPVNLVLNAAAQTRQQQQLPAAAPAGRHAQDTAAQVTCMRHLNMP